MPTQDRKKKPLRGKRPADWEAMPPLNPNAAGIDVRNVEHYVAVPAGRDAEPVQKFGSFTADAARIHLQFSGFGVIHVITRATAGKEMIL